MKTASGTTKVNDRVDIYGHQLGEASSALVLDSTPRAMAVGRIRPDNCYACHWPPYVHPRRIWPNGKDVPLSVDHYAPYTIPDVACPVMESCPTGPSDNEGSDVNGAAPESSLNPEALTVGHPGETLGEFARAHRAGERNVSHSSMARTLHRRWLMTPETIPKPWVAEPRHD